MQNKEILIVIILGVLLALILIAFVVTIVFLYQKRQQAHKLELVSMQDEYDQQILRVQFEMQEIVLAEISHKLHDALKGVLNGVSFSLSAVTMKLKKGLINNNDLIEILEEQHKDVVMVRDEIRLTSHSLSQDKLAKVGLVDTIEFEVNKIARNYESITVNKNINNQANYNFTQQQSIYLFRMFQEILNNIFTHAKATQIDITVDLNNKNIFTLIVVDNGVGFNVAEKRKSKLSGIGLSGLQKRAIQIGAEIQIISHLNIGTTIKIELPLILTSENDNNGKHKTPHYRFD